MIIESPGPILEGDDVGASESGAAKKNSSALFMVWSRFHSANSDSFPFRPAEGQIDRAGPPRERHPPAESDGHALVTHPLIPWLGLLLVTYGSNRIYCTGFSVP